MVSVLIIFTGISVAAFDFFQKRALQKTIQELMIKKNSLLEYVEAIWATNKRFVQDEKLHALNSLVSGISHELNTPLGNALLALSFIKDTFDKTPQDFEMRKERVNSALKLAIDSIQTSSNLVQKFKAASTEQTKGEFQIIYIKEFLQQLCQKKLDLLDSELKSIKLDVNSEPNLKVKVPVRSFSVIIENILNNSFTYAFAGVSHPLLQIQGKNINNDLELIIEDNGIGISKEELKNIFDPFFTTYRSNGHAGLGLSESQAMIAQHYNGAIQCQSIPGTGTRFTLNFPEIVIAPDL